MLLLILSDIFYQLSFLYSSSVTASHHSFEVSSQQRLFQRNWFRMNIVFYYTASIWTLMFPLYISVSIFILNSAGIVITSVIASINTTITIFIIDFLFIHIFISYFTNFILIKCFIHIGSYIRQFFFIL